MGCSEMVVAILSTLCVIVSLFVWFWISYKALDDDEMPLGVAIIIVMIMSALLGIEFYFLINVIIT